MHVSTPLQHPQQFDTTGIQAHGCIALRFSCLVRMPASMPTGKYASKHTWAVSLLLKPAAELQPVLVVHALPSVSGGTDAAAAAVFL